MTALNCCAPMVSLTWPWLMYSCTALLAMKRGADEMAGDRRTGVAGSQCVRAGGLGIEVLVVVGHVGQQRGAGDGAVERGVAAGRHGGGECRLVGARACYRFIESDRQRRRRDRGRPWTVAGPKPRKSSPQDKDCAAEEASCFCWRAAADLVLRVEKKTYWMNLPWFRRNRTKQ